MPLLLQVYSMAHRKEIGGEKVPNDQKIFSIYELHTDIIVKGSREVKFGHKVNIGTGKSNLILTCEVLQGNPADSTLYQDTMDKLLDSYGRVPRDSATDGGYASKANAEYAQEKGIVNIVFNKIVGSLKNITSSKNMETIPSDFFKPFGDQIQFECALGQSFVLFCTRLFARQTQVLVVDCGRLVCVYAGLFSFFAAVVSCGDYSGIGGCGGAMLDEGEIG